MNTELLIQCLTVGLTVFFIEGLLSVDNAASLALVANRARPEDRGKVVKYGMVGALVFRGALLFIASWLLANPNIGNWAKIIGGGFLIKLAIKSWTPEADSVEEANTGWIDKLLAGLGLSLFWMVVIDVEVIDLIFSLDNIFAAVALTNKLPGNVDVFGITVTVALLVTIISVSLGIISMRFITVIFIRLIEKHPLLVKSAVVVIGLLGIKLLLGGLLPILIQIIGPSLPLKLVIDNTELFNFVVHTPSLSGLLPSLESIYHVLELQVTEFVFSGIMLLIFFFPFVLPKKLQAGEDQHGTPYLQ